MFTTRPNLQGTFGMVSSTHWLASQSAMAVLEDGGNAFDAAVAAGLRRCTSSNPTSTAPAARSRRSLAGGGGEVRVLCGQGVAPGRGDGRALPRPRARPRARHRAARRRRARRLRRLAAAAARPRHQALADVLQYAIGYAEDGHPPVARRRDRRDGRASCSRPTGPRSAEVYLPGGAAAPGELFRNPALAATWRRLLAEAAAAARPRGADRGRARRLERGLRRRGARPRPPAPPWTPAASATPAR